MTETPGFENLVPVIEKHMPTTKVALVPGCRSNSSIHAEWVWSHQFFAPELFGQSDDTERIVEIARLIRKAIVLSRELQSFSRAALDHRLPPPLSREESLFPTLLARAEQACNDLLKENGFGTQTDKRTNFMSPVVARACRTVWLHEKLFHKGSNTPQSVMRYAMSIEAQGRSDEYRQKLGAWIEKNVPHSQHPDRPGELGRFIEDVFLTLGIVQRDGTPVSAATALRALRKLERKPQTEK